MDKKRIAEELDNLSVLYGMLQDLQIQQDHAITKQLPPEVKRAIKDIKDEFGPKMDALMVRIHALEHMIEDETLHLGESVGGDKGGFRAIYQPGKYSWDGKALMEYAQQDFHILKYRKQGKPNVRISHGK